MDEGRSISTVGKCLQDPLAFEVAATAQNKSSHLYEGERNKREVGSGYQKDSLLCKRFV
jgi:hypothetical protein